MNLVPGMYVGWGDDVVQVTAVDGEAVTVRLIMRSPATSEDVKAGDLRPLGPGGRFALLRGVRKPNAPSEVKP